MKRLILIISIFNLYGCVSYHWVKADGSSENSQRYEYACQAQSYRELPPDRQIYQENYHTKSTKDKNKNEKESSKSYYTTDLNKDIRNIFFKDCMSKAGFIQEARSYP